jgi:hypothetical protein
MLTPQDGYLLGGTPSWASATKQTPTQRSNNKDIIRVPGQQVPRGLTLSDRLSRVIAYTVTSWLCTALDLLNTKGTLIAPRFPLGAKHLFGPGPVFGG